jgi:ADP-ribose pyrophosphatase YjhB (NUDIX family)
MTINSTFTWNGKIFKAEYSDLDTFSKLPFDKCQQVYGVCFYGEKIVIVKGGDGNDGLGWGLVGGHIEKGETFEETLTREVQEESNMIVIKSLPVGVQKVTSPNGEFLYQLRYMAIVKPLGKFEKDPAGNVIEIKLIDPKDYKNYFNWGEIGERIIRRATELKYNL